MSVPPKMHTAIFYNIVLPVRHAVSIDKTADFNAKSVMSHSDHPCTDLLLALHPKPNPYSGCLSCIAHICGMHSHVTPGVNLVATRCIVWRLLTDSASPLAFLVTVRPAHPRGPRWLLGQGEEWGSRDLLRYLQQTNDNR